VINPNLNPNSEAKKLTVWKTPIEYTLARAKAEAELKQSEAPPSVYGNNQYNPRAKAEAELKQSEEQALRLKEQAAKAAQQAEAAEMELEKKTEAAWVAMMESTVHPVGD